MMVHQNDESNTMLKRESFIGTTGDEADQVEKFLSEIVHTKDKVVTVDRGRTQVAMETFHRLHAQEKQTSEQEHNATLSDKNNIERLNAENGELKARLNLLTTSTKKAPPSKNQQVMEHIDTTRLSKLVANFKKIYDTEWIQAFVELKKKGFPDELIIVTLADILKGADSFCKDTAAHQLRSMLEQNYIVLQEIRQPRLDLKEIGGPKMASKAQPVTRATEKITSKHLKSYRKELADLSTPGLIDMFTDGIVTSFLSSQLYRHSRTKDPKGKQIKPETVSTGLTTYVNKVIVLVWMMTLQEPTPAFLWNEPGAPVKKECFAFYTKRGSVVAQTVWPAVLLHKDGPLMSKGIVNVR